VETNCTRSGQRIKNARCACLCLLELVDRKTIDISYTMVIAVELSAPRVLKAIGYNKLLEDNAAYCSHFLLAANSVSETLFR